MPRLVNFRSPIRRQSPLNKGLLRWWLAEPFRNHSPRLRDLTGKSPMTLSGALRLGSLGRPGGFSTCVFNGTSDYGQTAAIDLSGISTMTLSMWVYVIAYATNDLLLETSADVNSNTAALQIILDSGGTWSHRIKTTTGNNTYRFTSRPSAGAWLHYAVVMDRNAGAQQIVAVYVNGVSFALTSTATDTDSAGGFGNYAWNFCSRNATSLFGNVRLDDIRVYDRLLPAWEVRALRNASRRGYPNELRWSRGVDFLGEAPAVEEETEVETFSVGGAGPLGAEEIPNTVLASATSLTVPAGTKYATIQAVGANFNYFISGDTPTTGSTGDGRKLYNYGMIELDCGFTSAKFIREGNTANSKLVVEYFSRKTEE